MQDEFERNGYDDDGMIEDEEEASHGNPSGDPLAGLLGVEEEDDEAVHGEADEEGIRDAEDDEVR